MDYIIERLPNSEIGKKQLIGYLLEQDGSFDIPLSQRTDIKTYIEKLLKFGRVLVIWVNNNIEGVVAYYCNDQINRKAYGSLYLTSGMIRRKRLSFNLFIAMFEDCYSAGMRELYAEVSDERILRIYMSYGCKVLSQEIKYGGCVRHIKFNIEAFLEHYKNESLLNKNNAIQ